MENLTENTVKLHQLEQVEFRLKRDLREREIAMITEQMTQEIGDWAFMDLDGSLAEASVHERIKNAPATEPERSAIPRFGVLVSSESEEETLLAHEAEALLGYNVLRRKLKLGGKLGQALAALEIEPLDTDAVNKYKNDMVAFRLKALGPKAFQRTGRQTIVTEVSWRRVLLSGYNAASTEVPTFALRKAAQIKKACGEAVLSVDELVEQRRVIDPFLVATLADEVYYVDVWKEPKFEATL